MGVSIDIHVYDIDKLRTGLIAELPKQDPGFVSDFLDKAMDGFGRVDGNNFYVLWNEYWDEYNPGANFVNAFERYFDAAEAELDALWGYDMFFTKYETYHEFLSEEYDFEPNEEDF